MQAIRFDHGQGWAPRTMLSEIHTVEYLLEQWARWAYINRGLSVYYPGIEPHERFRARGPSCAITDEQAEAIDAVVSALRMDNRRAHDALALYYVARYPYREIAKAMKHHHRTSSDLVEQGRMYVKAGLRFGAPKPIAMARRQA